MEYQEHENYFEYDSSLSPDKRKYLVVIIYDIMDNKRRSKMAKYLQSFGFRVQRSAFECILDKKGYNNLVDSINKYVEQEDSLRIYRLAGYTDMKIWGSQGETESEEVIIV